MVSFPEAELHGFNSWSGAIFASFLVTVAGIFLFLGLSYKGIAQWLRAHSVLPEDQRLVPSIQSGGSWLLLSPAPGDVIPSCGL